MVISHISDIDLQLHVNVNTQHKSWNSISKIISNMSQQYI